MRKSRRSVKINNRHPSRRHAKLASPDSRIPMIAWHYQWCLALCPVVALIAAFAVMAIVLHVIGSVSDSIRLLGAAGCLLVVLAAAAIAVHVVTSRITPILTQQMVDRIDARVMEHTGRLRENCRQRGARMSALADKLTRGERLTADDCAPPPQLPADHHDPFAQLDFEAASQAHLAERCLLELQDMFSRQQADLFGNFAHRMQSLLHEMIKFLTEMEDKTESPRLLDALFILDHYTVRLRRITDVLAVIGGATPRRVWRKWQRLAEVLRGAVSEIRHYDRVKVKLSAEVMVSGTIVANVMHLIAELLENGTRFSPAGTDVTVTSDLTDKGVLIQVIDHGVGLQTAVREALNRMLEGADQAGRHNKWVADGCLGLYSAAVIAQGLEIPVWLRSGDRGGTIAAVLLPSELVREPTPQTAGHNLSSAPHGERRAIPGREPRQGESRHAAPEGRSASARPGRVAETPLDANGRIGTHSAPSRGPAAGENSGTDGKPLLPKRIARRHGPPSSADPAPEMDLASPHSPGLIAGIARGKRRWQTENPDRTPPAS